ncbi:hypothetical protein ACOME3_008306 [Neoechinorhynchus agilis]
MPSTYIRLTESSNKSKLSSYSSGTSSSSVSRDTPASNPKRPNNRRSRQILGKKSQSNTKKKDVFGVNEMVIMVGYKPSTGIDGSNAQKNEELAGPVRGMAMKRRKRPLKGWHNRCYVQSSRIYFSLLKFPGTDKNGQSDQ